MPNLSSLILHLKALITKYHNNRNISRHANGLLKAIQALNPQDESNTCPHTDNYVFNTIRGEECKACTPYPN